MAPIADSLYLRTEADSSKIFAKPIAGLQLPPLSNIKAHPRRRR
jgi:hypothetical protein